MCAMKKQEGAKNKRERKKHQQLFILVSVVFDKVRGENKQKVKKKRVLFLSVTKYKQKAMVGW